MAPTRSRRDRLDEVRRGAAGAAVGVVSGSLASHGFGKLYGRARSGKPFPHFGNRVGDTVHGPLVDDFLSKTDPNPLVLDKAKWNAERKRIGTKAIGIPFPRDMASDGGVLLSGTDAPTAFHELGHVANAGGLLDDLRKKTHSWEGEGPPSIGDGLRAGFLIGAVAHPQNKAGKFIHDNAALLTGLTEIPTLMDELRASYSALRGLGASGGAAAVKGGLKTLAPALATYLAGAGGRVGAVALARHMAGGHEKTAAGAAAPAASAAGAGAAPGAVGGGGAAKAPTLGVPKMPSQPKVTGSLRLSSIAANATPIGQLKPKTTPAHPGNRRGNFPGIPAAKPPSLTGFYRDTLDSMDAPSRGTRT